MSHSFESVAAKYLAAKKLSSGTCKEYRGTVTKRTAWGKGVDVDQIGKFHLRDFLDWVHEKAAADGGSNAGRTANKSRENLEGNPVVGVGAGLFGEAATVPNAEAAA